MNHVEEIRGQDGGFGQVAGFARVASSGSCSRRSFCSPACPSVSWFVDLAMLPADGVFRLRSCGSGCPPRPRHGCVRLRGPYRTVALGRAAQCPSGLTLQSTASRIGPHSRTVRAGPHCGEVCCIDPCSRSGWSSSSSSSSRSLRHSWSATRCGSGRSRRRGRYVDRRLCGRHRTGGFAGHAHRPRVRIGCGSLRSAGLPGARLAGPPAGPRSRDGLEERVEV